MENFFIVEPSVDGELGPHTNQLADPKLAQQSASAEYAIDCWSGDDLLSAHPYFFTTTALKEKLTQAQVSGVSFAPAIVSKSYRFEEFPQNVSAKLPALFLLRATGKVGQDDVAITQKGTLVVSARCLALLQSLKIENASLYRWDGSDIEHTRLDSSGHLIRVDNSARLVQLARALSGARQKTT
jgi:hypothetical protein